MATIVSDEFYALTPMEGWVVKELTARKNNIGLNSKSDIITKYTTPGEGVIDQESFYRGPKTAWVRFVSNAKVTTGDTTREAFQLFNHGGFSTLYGFDGSKTVLGYDAVGMPHTLEGSEFEIGAGLHVPPPGVQSLQTEMLGGDGGKFRKATVKLVVPSFFQLDYITPYFLVPGITCVLEWGWNNFNPSSIIDISKVGTSKVDVDEAIYRLKSDPDNRERLRREYNNSNRYAIQAINERISTPTGIRGRLTDYSLIKKARQDSFGNYDSMIGKITNFSYNIRADRAFDVTIELLQLGEAIYGLQTESNSYTISNPTTGENEALINISKMFDQELTKALKAKKSEEVVFFNGNNEGLNIVMAGNRILTKDIMKKGHIKIESDDTGWIKFGLFMELFNAFSQRVSNEDKNIKLFKIDISNSYISANPNIKSTNGKILLIPSSLAPSLNFRPGSTSITTNLNSGDVKLETADKALQAVLSANSFEGSSIEKNRINIARFMNVFNPSEYFPQVGNLSATETGVYGIAGYYGHIKDLFVSVDIIRGVFSNTEKMADALQEVLNKMSSAAMNIWDFEIRSFDKNADGLNLTIVDKNFSTNIDKFKTNNQELFTFNVLDNKSIVKNLTFGISLPDSVAAQTIYGGSSNVSETTREESRFFSKMRVGNSIIDDRLVEKLNHHKTTPKPDNTGGSSNATTNKIKLLSKEEYVTVSYGKIDKANGAEVLYQMVEPNNDLLKTIISADKNPYNNAIYNGLVPGVEVEIEILGLSGIRFLDVFRIHGIPKNYADNAIFQVKNVRQQLSDNMWSTYITAGLRPYPSSLSKEESRNG